MIKCGVLGAACHCFCPNYLQLSCDFFTICMFLSKFVTLLIGQLNFLVCVYIVLSTLTCVDDTVVILQNTYLACIIAGERGGFGRYFLENHMPY